jgi:hypothetical protein
VLYPTYLALEVLFGRGLAAATDFGGDYEAKILPVYATTLGYVAMMSTYVARGTFSDLEALRPVLQGGEATHAELRKRLARFDRRRLRIGGLLGVAFYCLASELAGERWTHLLAGEWSLQPICIAAFGFLGYGIVGRLAVYLIDSSRLYSRIGERRVMVDLLAFDPLLPLTRHGLRIVLLVTIWVAVSLVGTLFVYTSRPGGIIAMLPFFVCLLGLATAAFVLPIRGLRRHIRARKTEELVQLRDEIRRNRELVTKSGTESADAGARLPGLLAYMNQVESVREWPFDAPTLTRFFLYVAIPLGSWVGGALVERLLGAALD